MKHNRLVSFNHLQKTTKRNRLIVNAKKRNIIDSFVDSIEYSDRRISTIVDVTKTIFFERWFKFVSFQLTKAFVFTMIRLNHQIKFRSLRKHHIWTRVESEFSLFDQKSDSWSSIFESFFLFENFSTFYQVF